MAQAQVDTPQVAFEKMLVAMMSRLDDLMEKYQFQDGEYKEFAEDLLQARNLQAQIKLNTVYVEIVRHVNRPRKQKASPPSLEEKMTSEKYEWCEYCNTPIKIHNKGYFKKLHLQTAKCSQIAQTKKTTIKKPIFKNVGFDIPLQVINRCVWKKMRRDISIPAQRFSLYYYSGEDDWEKMGDGRWRNTEDEYIIKDMEEAENYKQ